MKAQQQQPLLAPAHARGINCTDEEGGTGEDEDKRGELHASPTPPPRPRPPAARLLLRAAAIITAAAEVAAHAREGPFGTFREQQQQQRSARLRTT
ncbi:Hypothetical predicted protein [Podarcis lilfordi]|uniref:Uncharacterized protein n=1 Tax=Podarcis lilfordi TaxID=74358 RepID=A0AA35L8J2_9SAUR|nr:Hypothetical predicted protein [Podarcis lilfordi]